MPAANPIVNAAPAAQGMPQGPGAPPVAAAASTGLGSLAVTSHRIPQHVGLIVLAALVTIILLHLGGFRFVFDVGLGRTR